MTIVSLFWVMRLTGPSNVQSKMMLVVSQRIRGLSFGPKRAEARGDLLAELGQLGAADDASARRGPPPGGSRRFVLRPA